MRINKRHPVIDRHLKEIREKLKTKTINAIGKEYGIDKATIWRYAKIYRLKGVDMRQALSIEWTPDMLRILKMKFAKTFNAELADQLRVSPRTLIRKARELQLVKEPDFLEKRRSTISKMARAAQPEKRTPAQIEQVLKAGINSRFAKGHKPQGIDYSKVWATRRMNELKLKEALSNPY